MAAIPKPNIIDKPEAPEADARPTELQSQFSPFGISSGLPPDEDDDAEEDDVSIHDLVIGSHVSPVEQSAVVLHAVH
jgi:hypothetical protein